MINRSIFSSEKYRPLLTSTPQKVIDDRLREWLGGLSVDWSTKKERPWQVKAHDDKENDLQVKPELLHLNGIKLSPLARQSNKVMALSRVMNSYT